MSGVVHGKMLCNGAKPDQKSQKMAILGKYCLNILQVFIENYLKQRTRGLSVDFKTQK